MLVSRRTRRSTVSGFPIGRRNAQRRHFSLMPRFFVGVSNTFIFTVSYRLRAASRTTLSYPDLSFFRGSQSSSRSPVLLLSHGTSFASVSGFKFVHYPSEHRAGRLLIVCHHSRRSVIIFLRRIFRVGFLRDFKRFRPFDSVYRVQYLDTDLFTRDSSIFYVNQGNFPSRSFSFFSLTRVVILLS